MIPFWILLSTLLLFFVFTIITIVISSVALTQPSKINSSTQTLLDLSNVASIDNTHLVSDKFQTENGFTVANSNITCNILTVSNDAANSGGAIVNTFVLTSELKWPNPIIEPQSLQSNSILLGTQSLNANGILYTENESSVLFSDHVLISDEFSSLDIKIGDIEISNKFLTSFVFIGTNMNLSTTGSGGTFLFLPSPSGFQSGSLNFSNLYQGFTLRVTASGTFTTAAFFSSSYMFVIGNTSLTVDGQPQQTILGELSEGLSIPYNSFSSSWTFHAIITMNVFENNNTLTMQSFGVFQMEDDTNIAPQNICQKASNLFNGLQLSFWGITSSTSELSLPVMTLQQLHIEQLR